MYKYNSTAILYNSSNPPPWGYPEAAKQSGIKSKSFNSPLENFNELMFNDEAGFELINLQAQRDLNSLVKNDETRTVNRNRTTTIDNDETITVHGNRTEVVDKDESITIHQNRTEVVDKNESITIHQNRTERVDQNETISIGGDRNETVHKSETITIKGNRDKTVHGNDKLIVNKNRKETINKSRALNVDKNNTELVKMAKSVTVGLAYATQVGTVMNTAVGIMQTEQIGRTKKSVVGKSYSISVGDRFEITVGDSKIIMTKDSIHITSKTIVVGAEHETVIIGKDVLINPPGGVGSSEVESDYLNDEPAQIGADGLPVLGSDSDEMTDEELFALNDQMIEDAIANNGLMAMSSRKGLTNDSKAPKKPTGYNKDGTKQTQKQINDAWIAYYDHKNKAEALAKRQKEDKSFFDKAKNFLGFDDDSQTDNVINTARNAAVTGVKLPGTGTMAAGDTLLGAGPSAYGGFDTELRKDYDYFVREGRLPDKPGASAFPAYEKARQRINKEFVEKHKGAGWTEPGKDGRSPQNDIWGKK